jgi:hypothetical protein
MSARLLLSLLVASAIGASVVLTAAHARAAAVPSTAQAKDYPAAVYKGAKTLPDFTRRDKDFVSFRTRIRDGIKQGPNFAGHLSLIVFGCGTGCSVVFAADVRTGEVRGFPLGGEDTPYLHLAYRLGSRLVAAHWLKEERCVRQKFVWEEDGFASSAVSDAGDQETCDALWLK